MAPIPESLLDAIRMKESGNLPPERQVSSAGALGPYQFMPATGRQYGLNTPQDFFDPVKSREAARSLMSDLVDQFGGNLDHAIAAYNAGPGRVRSSLTTGAPLPAETQAYVPAVKSYWAANERQGPPASYWTQTASAAPTAAGGTGPEYSDPLGAPIKPLPPGSPPVGSVPWGGSATGAGTTAAGAPTAGVSATQTRTPLSGSTGYPGLDERFGKLRLPKTPTELQAGGPEAEMLKKALSSADDLRQAQLGYEQKAAEAAQQQPLYSPVGQWALLAQMSGHPGLAAVGNTLLTQEANRAQAQFQAYQQAAERALTASGQQQTTAATLLANMGLRREGMLGRFAGIATRVQGNYRDQTAPTATALSAYDQLLHMAPGTPRIIAGQAVFRALYPDQPVPRSEAELDQYLRDPSVSRLKEFFTSAYWTSGLTDERKQALLQELQPVVQDHADKLAGAIDTAGDAEDRLGEQIVDPNHINLLRRFNQSKPGQQQPAQPPEQQPVQPAAAPPSTEQPAATPSAPPTSSDVAPDATSAVASLFPQTLGVRQPYLSMFPQALALNQTRLPAIFQQTLGGFA